jgi:hypothetical protein
VIHFSDLFISLDGWEGHIQAHPRALVEATVDDDDDDDDEP